MMASSNAEALRSVLQHLSASLVYTEPTNIETNKKLWNQYAKDYYLENNNEQQQEPAAWVSKMARQVGRENKELNYIGTEWSNEFSLQQTMEQFLYPLLDKSFSVAEVGVGGGRIAARVAHKVNNLVCFDIAQEMINQAKSALSHHSNIDYVLLEGPQFPRQYSQLFDCIYCFDVLPHVDLHTIYAYFQSFKTILKPGGSIFLSVADVTSPLGFDRFSRQSKYTAGGFYFICPQIIQTFAQKCGYKIIKESKAQDSTVPADQQNVYYNRDYLVILQPIN
jgi:2-polyprenyl-3-methyl-5-hydroxy-6-metoxy-1,4-benzoquinol methylase